MLVVTYAINFLGMILFPILLGIYLARRFKLSWKLFLAGALAFIASQVLHIPLLQVLTAMFKSGALPAPPQAWSNLFNAVLLGLLAGIFEETARFILFRYILKSARNWQEGLMVGAGHGGIEAIILGCLTAASYVTMLAWRNGNTSALPLSPDQLAALSQQVSAYWSAPVYYSLLGFAERIFAICMHLALTMMVLRSVALKQPVWFWLALLWHAVIDGVSVYFLPIIGALGIEGIVGLFALLNLGLLFWLRPSLTPPAQPEPTVTV
jgi:uncharacterized membrane protein YhfC